MSNDPYRVLVTGSTDWDDERLVYATMRLVFVLGHYAQITWVHGGAPGLDTMVRQFVEGSWNHFDGGPPEASWLHEAHAADWSAGRQAGHWRNSHMVNLDARYCLAFINPCIDKRCTRQGVHGSHGTIDCATKAEEAGIETWRFNRAVTQD